MNNVLINYPFVGHLANHIADFIAEKRAVGRKYNTEAKKLYEFSRCTNGMSVSPNELPNDKYGYPRICDSNGGIKPQGKIH